MNKFEKIKQKKRKRKRKKEKKKKRIFDFFEIFTTKQKEPKKNDVIFMN